MSGRNRKLTAKAQEHMEARAASLAAAVKKRDTRRKNAEIVPEIDYLTGMLARTKLGGRRKRKTRRRSRK